MDVVDAADVANAADTSYTHYYDDAYMYTEPHHDHALQDTFDNYLSFDDSKTFYYLDNIFHRSINCHMKNFENYHNLFDSRLNYF